MIPRCACDYMTCRFDWHEHNGICSLARERILDQAVRNKSGFLMLLSPECTVTSINDSLARVIRDEYRRIMAESGNAD